MTEEQQEVWDRLTIPDWEHVWKVSSQLYYVDPRNLDRATGQRLVNRLSRKYPDAVIEVRQWWRKEFHEYANN